MTSILVHSLVTPWATAVFAVSLVVLLLLSHVLVRRGIGFGTPLYGASVALSPVLAVTLSPSGANSGSVFCGLSPRLDTGITDFPAVTEQFANSVMLAPFGFFAALAFRRWWIALFPVLAAPVLIETTHMLVPALGRSCTLQDVFDNLTGGLLGIVLGFLVRGGVHLSGRTRAPTR
ncbi:VanZ family protein [Actinopolyspora mortivallis]|nr:VanZ family protein [Actinopolyspora mortivallis]